MITKDAPTDKPEKRITHFAWSMKELKEDLENWSDITWWISR